MGNDQSDLHLLLDEGGTPMGIIVISWWDFWLRGDSQFLGGIYIFRLPLVFLFF
jgi:hypothetical protein